MKTPAIFKLKTILLSASALVSLLPLFAKPVNANVVISGRNGHYTDGCNVPTTVPEPLPLPLFPYSPNNVTVTCGVEDKDVFADYSGGDFTVGNHFRSGIMIGANLSNTNTGDAVTGSATITNGNVVSSAFVFAGFEGNTTGIIDISGAGSRWTSMATGVIGHYGTGSLILRDGGQYNQTATDNFFLGYEVGSHGTLLVNGVNATGERSSVIVLNRSYFGTKGDAAVRIEDGGLVSSRFSTYMANAKTSEAIMFVDGVNSATNDRSTFTVLENQFRLGDEGGKGTLSILNGGLVKVNIYLLVGGNSSHVYINGMDTRTGYRSEVIADGLYAGYYATGSTAPDFPSSGHVYVQNGGHVDTGYFYVGASADTSGTVVLEGSQGNTASSINIRLSTQPGGGGGSGHIGYAGDGTMIIRDGGQLNILNNLSVGYSDDAVGLLTMHGAGSQAIMGNDIRIGHAGEGTLELYNNALMRGRALSIGSTNTGNGKVYIGKGGIAGTLDVDFVQGGTGDSELYFNHTNDITFTPRINGNLDVYKQNTGTTTLGATSIYTGKTNVSAGILRAGVVNSFSANSDFHIAQGGVMSLNGLNQSVKSIENAGILRFGGNGGTMLTIADGYHGNGGIVEVSAVLGDDTSITDMVRVGDITGTTNIRVKNVNGVGAVTAEGIKVIDSIRTSNATFALIDGYMHEGKMSVVGGAYAYKLHKGGVSTPSDGDWYLRSSLLPIAPRPTPQYQAGVPTYEAYPQALLDMNGLDTLQQRVGNRAWAYTQGGGMSGSGDGVHNFAMPHVDGKGLWARVSGLTGHIEPTKTQSSTKYKQNTYKAQAGIETVLMEEAASTIIGGAFAHYVHGQIKTDSRHGHGEISSHGYGGGGSLTWYDNDGMYVDAQAQATWYTSDLSSTLANRALKNGNDGFGYAASLETGQRVQIADDWAITPQVQLSYSNVDFDSFTDSFAADVSLKKGDALQGRVGLGVENDTSWQNAKGLTNNQHIYGVANVYYDFLHSTKVDVANTSFEAEKGRLWAGLGVGGSLNWDDNKYSVYGEASVNTSVKHFGDSYNAKGTVGLRARF